MKNIRKVKKEEHAKFSQSVLFGQKKTPMCRCGKNCAWTWADHAPMRQCEAKIFFQDDVCPDCDGTGITKGTREHEYEFSCVNCAGRGLINNT